MMAAFAFGSGSLFAATAYYWDGATSEKASVAANWKIDDGAGGRTEATTAPVSGDSIVIDSQATSLTMTWDLDEVAPASWLQEDWAGTVTIPTGIRGQKASGSTKTVYGYTLEDGSNTSLRVTGNVTLNSGTWTGQLNPGFAANDNGLLTGEGIYRLRADVGGNFTLAADATITVDRLGYQGQGPGCNTYGCSKGASHGGRGSPYTAARGRYADGERLDHLHRCA